MVVDDSAVVRQSMSALFAETSGIAVEVASDPLFALKKMEHTWPDVIVLDLEMPRMDGLTFLRKIMRERPTPVVICSSFAESGAEPTLEALASGAVEIVTKPKFGLKSFLDDESLRIIEVVRAAAGARVRPATTRRMPEPQRPATRPAGPPVGLRRHQNAVIAIGASTGGTQALDVVLGDLPPTTPGILVVQHMPEEFTGSFAQRLNRSCAMEIREARDGDRLHEGLVLIARGDHHLTLGRDGEGYFAEVGQGPPVHRHRPSVDVLFRSVARAAGDHALGIIMTGMGGDGALGLGEMRESGARTIAQDEASCVVFGMPREAIKRGSAETVLPLTRIAGEIKKFHEKSRTGLQKNRV